MKVTAFTSRAIAYRREVQRLIAAGYEEVGEGGGKLWQLHRGSRQDHEITEVVIGPDKKSLWIKTQKLVPTRHT